MLRQEADTQDSCTYMIQVTSAAGQVHLYTYFMHINVSGRLVLLFNKQIEKIVTNKV